MARTLNEQLLHDAGLLEPESPRRKPKLGLLTRASRLVFYARLGVLLLALVVAITFMVLPWPGTLRAALYDVAGLAALIWLGSRWRRYRNERTTTHESEPRR
jgi:hypothetical protein